MKYLKLEFDNARYIKTTKDTKDCLFTKNGYVTRTLKDTFVEEGLTIFQISNILHVLFNERPVPSMRDVIYKRNEYLFNKASLSYLKYSDKVIFEESFNTKKALYNSKNKLSYMSWFRVKRICKTDERYDSVIEKLNNNAGFNVLDYSFNNYKDIIRKKMLIILIYLIILKKII